MGTTPRHIEENVNEFILIQVPILVRVIQAHAGNTSPYVRKIIR